MFNNKKQIDKSDQILTSPLNHQAGRGHFREANKGNVANVVVM